MGGGISNQSSQQMGGNQGMVSILSLFPVRECSTVQHRHEHMQIKGLWLMPGGSHCGLRVLELVLWIPLYIDVIQQVETIYVDYSCISTFWFVAQFWLVFIIISSPKTLQQVGFPCTAISGNILLGIADFKCISSFCGKNRMKQIMKRKHSLEMETKLPVFGNNWRHQYTYTRHYCISQTHMWSVTTPCDFCVICTLVSHI